MDKMVDKVLCQLSGSGNLQLKNNMDLLDDLGSDIVFAVLVDKKFTEQIESTEVLPLISKLKEALRTVSEKDHLRGEHSSQTVVTSN